MDNASKDTSLEVAKKLVIAKKSLWEVINNPSLSTLFPEFKKEALGNIIEIEKLINKIKDQDGDDSSDGRGRYLQGYIDALALN